MTASAWPSRRICSACAASVIEPDRAHRHARRPAARARRAGPGSRARSGSAGCADEPAAGDVEEVGARARAPSPATVAVCSTIPAALGPVGRREPDEDGNVGRRHRPGRLARLAAAAARGSRASRRTRRRGGSTAARGTGAAGSRARRGSRAARSRRRPRGARLPRSRRRRVDLGERRARAARRSRSKATADGATVGQPPSSCGNAAAAGIAPRRPGRGLAAGVRELDARRPRPAPRMTRRSAPRRRAARRSRCRCPRARCGPRARPRSPRRSTRPAPPLANEPRWTGASRSACRPASAPSTGTSAGTQSRLRKSDAAQPVLVEQSGHRSPPRRSVGERRSRKARSPGTPVKWWPMQPSATAASTLTALLSMKAICVQRHVQLCGDVPVDLRVGLDQPELSADEDPLEEARARRAPERIAEVGTRVGEHREPRAAGVQVLAALRRCRVRR